MAAPAQRRDVEFARADVDDLHRVRAVIAAAIRAWPTTERLRRNALNILSYDAVDLADTHIVMALQDGEALGIAAWRDHSWMADPAGKQSALLHGLYVDGACQRTGLGACLQRFVASAVLDAGGHGLHVRAERFAVPYFERCGYRRLTGAELIGVTGAYPHRFWIACGDLLDITDPR